MIGLDTLRGAAEQDADARLFSALDQLRAFHASEGVVSGAGLEALIAGAVLGMGRRAWLLPGRRERGVAILRGADRERLEATRPYRVLPPGEEPAQRALQAVGMALAGDPVLVFLGTGSISYGAALEALSLSVLQQAPVCFVVSWYTDEGPFARQLAVDPVVLARALGMEAEVVDGTDARAVMAAVAGPLPRLVQADLRGKS